MNNPPLRIQTIEDVPRLPTPPPVVRQMAFQHHERIEQNRRNLIGAGSECVHQQIVKLYNNHALHLAKNNILTYFYYIYTYHIYNKLNVYHSSSSVVTSFNPKKTLQISSIFSVSFSLKISKSSVIIFMFCLSFLLLS